MSLGRSFFFLVILISFEVIMVHGYPRQWKGSSPHATREWQYLTFTQIWPASFCNFETCHYPQSYSSWNIHGLWPSVYEGKGPEYCSESPSFDMQKLNPIYNDLVEDWMDLKNYEHPVQFWSHEWNAHGTCATSDELLLDELKYFNATLLLKKAIQTRQRLDEYGISPMKGRYVKTDDLLEAIRTIYRVNGDVTCLKRHDTDYYLYEIRLCLTRDMILMDCPARHHFSTYSTVDDQGRRHAGRHNLTATSVRCGEEFLYEL